MSQHQSRKHFLAKALGLTAVAVAVPRALAQRVSASPAVAAQPSAPANVKLAVESRAVARRNGSL